MLAFLKLLANRLRVNAEARQRGELPPLAKTMKRQESRDRHTARRNGDHPEYRVDLFSKSQTTFETQWVGGSLFAGAASEASSEARADKAAINRKRNERRKKQTRARQEEKRNKRSAKRARK